MYKFHGPMDKMQPTLLCACVRVSFSSFQSGKFFDIGCYDANLLNIL